MTVTDPDAPELQYSGRTPYVAYTGADVLSQLAAPRTDEPLEVTFVVATQIMELHFDLLLHDLRVTVDDLDADDLNGALAGLRRTVVTQKSLVRSWDLLSEMSARQYNRFREALGKASGFQSFAYREMEFRLGAKDARLLHPHAGMPAVHRRLQQAFDAPSVYQAALALLSRRGLPVPDSALRPAAGPDQESMPAVVEVWRQVYQRDDELSRLADCLTAVAEWHSTWRFVHYNEVRRILGSKPGTGGSAGLAWLKRSVDAPLFTELWEVRGVL